LRQVGWALTASAGTVVIGLGMMGFAEFAKLRYTGPAIALSLVFALAASLTLAPALLRVAGTWAFWPRRWASLRPRLRPADPEERGRPTFWDWVSAKISARPLTIWAVTVLLLLPLAILGYRTVYVYDICAELPRDSESQKGLDIIRRHFVVGEIGPLTVLLQGKKDWAGPEGRAFIADLSARLERMPNVAEVRSLHQPLGTPIATPAANGPKYDPTTMLSKLGDSIAAKVAATRYVARLPEGNVTRVDVVFRSEPFALESCQTMTAMQRVLERFIRASKFEDAQFAFYGVTPLTSDFAMVHEGDRFRVNSLVLGGILLILLIVVRKPVVAIYLLLSVLFSYYVTIGATELMVLGWLDNHLAQVDWKVPYFLFTILVAIGEDYNIFLIARVLEERKRYGMHEGTKRALARTGATITSCGLIMAGTFATMMLCSLTTLVQLGLALAFGVLLDTFIVRPILVPTFLLMTNRDRATATPQPQTVPFPTVEPEVLRRSA
jgi:RND superfamily putative drug exporter